MSFRLPTLRPSLLALAACLLLLSAAPDRVRAQEAVLLVKLQGDSETSLRVGSAPWGVRTGLASLDAKIERHRGLRFERVFRPAGRHEAHHRAQGLHLWYRLVLPAGTDASRLAATYRGDEHVEIARPRQRYQLIEGAVLPLESGTERITPNDRHFGKQWHYDNTGQNGGLVDADIDLPEAWDLSTGDPSVVVSVLDTGADLDHPDLAPNLWTNPGEIPGNGIDDDDNGFVDDVHGYDFSDDDGNPEDFDGHGTHTAGTIAAVTNNGTGVAGIAGGNGGAGGARVMVAKIFEQAYDDVIAEAFIYAADNGAVISSNSWGGGGQSNLIENAIDYFIANAGREPGARISGGVVVFAAGNDDSQSTSLGYPASYAPTIAVAATDRLDRKAWYSNYGSWVDLSAPGSDVASTYLGGNYKFSDGTSMACPHVAGVAALIASYEPGLTAAQVRSRLESTTDDIYPLNPGAYAGKLGTGRLNAYAALTAGGGGVSDPPDVAVSPASLASTLAPGATGSQTLTIENTGDEALTFSVELATARQASTAQAAPAAAGTYLVFDADGTDIALSGETISSLLSGLGHTVDFTRSLASIADLSTYDAVFVSLGVYPRAVVLSGADATRLAAYLDGGGSLFMEGGETWAYDAPTSLHAYFNIDGLHDGKRELAQVEGLSGTLADGLTYGYHSQYNRSLDRLGAIAPAEAILRNVTLGHVHGVAYDAGTYKTVGLSLLLGALEGSGSTPSELLQAILAFFGTTGGGGGGGDTPDWLTVTPTTGQVPGGGQTNLSVDFDAAGLGAGAYAAEIRIATNDPDEPEVVVPVSLTVEDAATDPPTADVSPAAIDETLASGASTTVPLTVSNLGDEALAFTTSVEMDGARSAGTRERPPLFYMEGAQPDGLTTTYRSESGERVAVGRCGTNEPSMSDVLRVEQARRAFFQQHGVTTTTVEIPVAFHVVHKTDGTGNVSDAMIQDQIDVLNASFAGSGFQFTLKSTERIASNTLFNLDNSADQVMQTYADDPATTLNIYTGNTQYLGFVQVFPWEEAESNWIHGVVALYSSLPGGSAAPYDLGDTVVHEVGHYLGLYHTFQGGCSSPGDEIADTPPEREPAFGCPVGSDTCAGDGPDPIYNFMDYSDDDCMNHFTANQQTRMQQMVAMYKPSLGTPVVDPPAAWLAVDPAGGNVPGGGSTQLSVELDATGLADGTHQGEVVLATNDPARPEVRVPVSLTVGGGGGELTAVLYFDVSDLAGLPNGAPVATWPDASGNGLDATQSRTPRQPAFGSTALGGQPGVVFQAGFLQIPNDPVFNTGGPYPERSFALTFRTGGNVADRQVIYEQGDGTRGVNVYLDGGLLYVSAWNRGNDGAGTPWGPVTLSRAVAANTTYALEAELDGTGGTLSASVDGTSFGSAGGAGALHASNGGAGIGAMYDDTRFHDGVETGTNKPFSGVVGSLAVYDGLMSARTGAVQARLSNAAGQGFTASAKSLGASEALPTQYALEANYPNPFNPSTTLRFQLPEAASVTLAVYDVLGRRVRTLVYGTREAGYHTVEWNGRDEAGRFAPSGTYFYVLEAGDFRDARQMLLVK